MTAAWIFTLVTLGLKRLAEKMAALPVKRGTEEDSKIGPLIDEQDEDSGVRIVLHYALRHCLQHHRLARLGGGDDHRALPLTERAEQVDNAIGVVLLAAIEIALQYQLILRVQCAQPVEFGTA